MTNFSVTGNVWKVEFADRCDNVWMTTENGTIKIEFDKFVNIGYVLRTLVDHNGNFLKDMTEELYIVHGEIMGEWEKPCFYGRFIRLI